MAEKFKGRVWYTDEKGKEVNVSEEQLGTPKESYGKVWKNNLELRKARRMDDSKPWEDESLKGAYHQEKKKQATVRENFKKKASLPPPKKEPSFSGAMAKAYAFKKRNERVDKLTKPLRKAATGGTSY